MLRDCDNFIQTFWSVLIFTLVLLSIPSVVIAENDTNVALGKQKITSSSSSLANSLDFLTDGKPDYGYILLPEGPQWIKLDLEQVYDVSCLTIIHYRREGKYPAYHDVVIRVSSDGTTWKTIFNNDKDNSLGLGTGTDSEYPEPMEGKSICLTQRGQVRYIEAWSNGNSDDLGNHYQEIEVYGSPIVISSSTSSSSTTSISNVALGKTVTASSPSHTNSLDFLVNGEYEGYIALDEGPQWIQVDLQGEYDIEKILLIHYRRLGKYPTYRDVVVEVSKDGNSWVTIFDNRAGGPNALYAETMEGKTIYPKTKVSARYVRAWSNGNSDDIGNHYQELEVWGTLAINSIVQKNRHTLYLNNQPVSQSSATLDGGSVSFSPAPDSDGKYEEGITVTLTAQRAEGKTASWGGDCSGVGGVSCSLVIGSNRYASVTFITSANYVTIGGLLFERIPIKFYATSVNGRIEVTYAPGTNTPYGYWEISQQDFIAIAKDRYVDYVGGTTLFEKTQRGDPKVLQPNPMSNYVWRNGVPWAIKSIEDEFKWANDPSLVNIGTVDAPLYIPRGSPAHQLINSLVEFNHKPVNNIVGSIASNEPITASINDNNNDNKSSVLFKIGYVPIAEISLSEEFGFGIPSVVESINQSEDALTYEVANILGSTKDELLTILNKLEGSIIELSEDKLFVKTMELYVFTTSLGMCFSYLQERVPLITILWSLPSVQAKIAALSIMLLDGYCRDSITGSLKSLITEIKEF